MTGRIITAAFIALVLLSGIAGVAVADNHTENSTAPGEQEDDNSGVVTGLNDLLEELQSFTDNWDTTLGEVLITVFFHPFKFLAQRLVENVSLLLTNTPTVHPNPAVEEVHRQTLLVSYLLSGLVFAVAGLLHMIGPILGVSYSEVRKILPRVVVALVFGTVSLPLLQFGVEFSDTLTQAFVPRQLAISFYQMVGLQSGLVLVYVINAVLLLALLAIFIIRAVYILFGAAISPLLALMWSIPRVKSYADTFIGSWFAALLIAPMDMLALKFILAMMEPQGVTPFQGVSNWLLGIAGILLLIFIPYQLWNASQAALGAAYGIGNTVKKGVKSRYHPPNIRLWSPEERRRIVLRRARNNRDPETGKELDNDGGGRR